MEGLQQVVAGWGDLFIVEPNKTKAEPDIGPLTAPDADPSSRLDEQGQDTDALDSRGPATESSPAALKPIPEPATPERKRRGPSREEQAFLAFLEDRFEGVVPDIPLAALAAGFSVWVVKNAPFEARDADWKRRHPGHQSWKTSITDGGIVNILKRHPELKAPNVSKRSETLAPVVVGEETHSTPAAASVANPSGGSGSPGMSASVGTLEELQQTGRKASTKNRPGRTKGTGYRRADEKLIAEMKQLVDSGEMPSPTKAAEMIADRAQGQSKESKVRRLVKVYYSVHPRKIAE
jgi:hypothetical protein